MSIMKKLGKLQINPDRLMKNEELMTLKGGYGSYECYMGGTWPNCYGFRAYINTASCAMAKDLCFELYSGRCVEGGDCTG
jgi:hypothetical protein